MEPNNHLLTTIQLCYRNGKICSTNMRNLKKSTRRAYAESFEKARLVFQSKESLPESLDFSTLKRPRLASYAPIKSKCKHPSWAKPGHLTIFFAQRVRNLTLACVGWEKLNRKCQDIFFGRLTAIKHVFGQDGRV